MAGDAKRIADIAAELASGEVGVPGATVPGKGGISGLIMGPDGNDILYKLQCVRPMPLGEFGPGRCGVYEIERSGPGAVGLRPKTTVGNLFGLTEQLSRDMARAWGCEPEKTRGFEGRSRRRR